MRNNERHLVPLHRLKNDPSKYAMEIPDEDVEDIVVVEVKVLHRHRDGGIFEQVGRSAAARYQYPTSGMEYRFHLNPDELVAENIGKLAKDAANLVLNERRLIHEHKKVVISGG